MVAEEQADSGRDGAFDPRYDPSFQRGYQPQAGERSRTRVRTDAPDSGFRRPSSLLGDADAPPAEPPPAPATPDFPALAAPADPVGPAGWAQDGIDEVALANPAIVVEAPGILRRLEVSPRRNPLILALWIVGVGFVVLGIVLYCISVTSSYSGPTPSSDVGSLVFAQLGWMLAGPLITVGLLTLVGLLFLNALAGRGGARESVPEEREL